MADKVDFKKRDRHLYAPSSKAPSVVEIPPLPFFILSGSGDPNTSELFSRSIEALFGLSYRIKMLPKKGIVPEGYFDYTVCPLEGVWDIPKGETFDPARKDRLIWTIGIRQPDFVTPGLVEEYRSRTAKEKKNPRINDIRLETIEDGLSCQIMHIGPFDDEPKTFERMQEWMNTEGYRRREYSHREIYLSDFRKAKPEKMKTVLRYRVERI